jgi:N-acetylglucosamine kinase-like BadF-type ATPase
MKYFLGIDVGSSKTHALIADEKGRCVGFGKAWGGNHQSVGYDGLENVLKESFEGAKQTAGVDSAHIAGAGFGVAGFDFESEKDAHLQAISTLGPSCPVEVVNDGVNGLICGTSHGIGVNVTAGSSNNCRGRGKNGREGRIVGNGVEFGEYGGGIEIAECALQMVNYAWIRRIPPTALTQILLDATGAKDELDLMEGISNNYYHLFPYIALGVIKAAKEGDAAAMEVVHRAGEELGWLAVAVARQIEMEDDELEVVQSGSIFDAGPIITEPMTAIVRKYLPKARLIRLKGPPVVGPLMLGMQMAGLDPYPLHAKLIETAEELVNGG